MIKAHFLRMSFLRLAGVALLLFGAFSSLTSAQTVSTRVSGVAKDTAGLLVSSVNVTLVDVGTRAEKTTTSNEEGSFVFSDVRPGTYTVTAEHAGFKKLMIEKVLVHVDIPAVLS